MFRLLAPLSLLLLASVASAQFANRRISDIRIVHPPGTPPGTWRIDADVEFAADALLPRPADFSFDMHVALNGVEIDVTNFPVSLDNTTSSCNYMTCNGGGCGGWFEFPNYYQGYCRTVVFHSGYTTCACNVKWTHHGGGSWSSSLRSSDVITVTIDGTPSSVADNEPGDDSLTLNVGDVPTGTPICGGDGTTPTPCPCGNTGALGNGCANSANPDGALLVASGWTGVDSSTGTDGVTLHGSGMPATSSAIYLKGDGLDSNGVVFGDGVLCVSGSLIRLRTKINVGGRSAFPEPGDPSLSVRGGTPPGSGLVARYQTYYRNAASGFCPPATFNVTSGVELEW